MSNSKEVIYISSSSDKNSENTPNLTNVPIPSGPSKVLSKKKPITWAQRYIKYWKSGKPQKIAMKITFLSEEGPEEKEIEEKSKEEPMEDGVEQRKLEDTLRAKDTLPTTSNDSACNGVESEPVVAFPLPGIHSEEPF